MIRKLSLIFILLAFITLGNTLVAQTKTTAKVPAKVSFTTDPATGVQYHFYKHDKKGVHPAMDDFVNIIMVFETEGDSVIFNSKKKGGDSLGSIQLNLKKTFSGCLEQGISMMAKGDSAEFRISTDSIFLKGFHYKTVPPSLASYKFLVFHIKLLKSMTRPEMMAQVSKAVQEKKDKERGLIAKYFKDSNITVTPTADSMFVIKHTVTTGTPVQEGDSVYVSYSGRLLNGTVFDASAKHGPREGMPIVNGQPALPAVYNKNMPLIKGWVIMLGTMREGESATILLPSALAYGERGASAQIGPFTPLLFDLQVLKVVKPTK